MFDFYFALDFVTNVIPKSFEQHDHQAYVAFKNLLIKVGDWKFFESANF